MEDIVAAGFTISVDGPITFSKDYDDMIKAVPLESIMIETDAPFAAPVPYRGKPCEPWMVTEVAKQIAELKGLDLEVVKTQLLDNAQRFFSLRLLRSFLCYSSPGRFINKPNHFLNKICAKKDNKSSHQRKCWSRESTRSATSCHQQSAMRT
jgi:hypothetical protein